MKINVPRGIQLVLFAATLSFFGVACEGDSPAPAPVPAPAPAPPPAPEPTVEDNAMAMRWWDVLSPAQMVAALYGEEATEEQTTAAQKPYAELDDETKLMVNETAAELYGDGGHMSVGAWWETLDCRLMRVAAGDGNTADPMSPFCAHYPGSGAAKILDDESLAWVNVVGLALLGRDDVGVYPADSEMAMRWWNVLNAAQMVAALYGDEATEEQTAAAQKPYAELDGETKLMVNETAAELYGDGGHMSVGAWWETLDCRLMRVAAGDGNTADPMSPFCAHYPGSGAAKILDDESLAWVNVVGLALLGRDDVGVYPADSEMAMRWWNVLNPAQMVAALYGEEATEEQTAAAQKPYAELDGETKLMVNETAAELYGDGGHMSVGAWWETLDCRLMRVAAGDGNTADPMSPFCAHYPGSGAAKILDDDSLAWVNVVGLALLGRDDVGVYPADSEMAMRWWNVLSPAQMVAALYGEEATEEQTAAAQKPYAELDGETKLMVNETAAELYGDGGHMSVGAWWETLDCRLMRVAAGDGNTADPTSPFCAHYPGSGAAKILDDDSLAWVNVVGLALLGRDDVGVYPADSEMAMRWWNVLSPAQMVAALYGDEATEEQTAAAQKPYAELDGETKLMVNETAAELYGDGGHMSVGAWWETLDCRLMRVAAGDGNTADPTSPFCAHYPGSGAAKILDDESLAWVNVVGLALLGRDDVGVYPADSEMAMRWWNVLSPAQMVAALYGDEATEEQTAAAQKPYAELDGETKLMVNETAAELYGDGGHMSVGAWWETLDCRLMRVAAGDGNTADPMSPFCAHYPGSGAAKILDDESLAWVNVVGLALLGRDDVGVYPADSEMAMRWWDVLNADQMVAALYGDEATEEQTAAAQKPYAELDGETKLMVNETAAELYGDGGHMSVGAWWETLDCRLMRVAAGDGNTADPTSPFCTHYPGSGAAKILDDDSLAWVNVVGMALLGRDEPGMYP